MLHSRQYSQRSSGVWHRVQPPQRPEPDDGGALAAWYLGKCPPLQRWRISTWRCRTSSATWSGARRAAAPWRSEKAAGSISQDTHYNGHCSLCSIQRFTRSFLCDFLWFFAVSLVAFFSLFWLFGVVCHARLAPCSCCCSHDHVSSPNKRRVGKQTPVDPELQLHVSQLSRQEVPKTLNTSPSAHHVTMFVDVCKNM